MSDSQNLLRSGNTRVVKLGGSLLNRERLVEQVHAWLEDHPASNTLIVVGGGAMVDAVRDLDANRRLPSEEVHWLCVDLLHLSFQICCWWFPEFDSLPDPVSLRSWLTTAKDEEPKAVGRVALVSPRAYYRQNKGTDGFPDSANEGSGSTPNPLPLDWRTTTDSIAAWFAKSVRADELVIWKSCAIPENESIAAMVAAGVLDEAFMDVSTGQSIFPLEKTKVVQFHPLTN